MVPPCVGFLNSAQTDSEMLVLVLFCLKYSIYSIYIHIWPLFKHPNWISKYASPIKRLVLLGHQSETSDLGRSIPEQVRPYGNLSGHAEPRHCIEQHVHHGDDLAALCFLISQRKTVSEASILVETSTPQIFKMKWKATFKCFRGKSSSNCEPDTERKTPRSVPTSNGVRMLEPVSPGGLRHETGSCAASTSMQRCMRPCPNM